jgi:carboxyl-terminal processing protease
MVQGLDPHSSYMTKEEHQELLIETKGSFSGVGIEITVKDNFLTVVSPIEGTPAYKSGIQAGDRIIKIDGKLTTEMSLPEAVKSIRGEKGTSVNLTIMREGSDKPLDFSLTRDVIPIKSVRSQLLTPKIGYVRISTSRVRRCKTSTQPSKASKKSETSKDWF